MVKIAFVLPVPNSKIIGGYKVIYEYANYIVNAGYDVTIIYNAHKGENSKYLPRFIVYLLRWKIGKYGPGWIDLDRRIHKIVKFSYDNYSFEGFDIVVATATETAEAVSRVSSKKFYFLQDFENWNGRSDRDVLDTFRLDLQVITISKWLQRIVFEASGKMPFYIPNGIDKNIYFEAKKFNQRKRHTVSFLYHDEFRKGCDVTLNVVNRLRETYHDLEVYAFGYPEKPIQWQEWIHYVHKASPEEVSQLMNQSRVFLCTSRKEGFGLTGLEAIFCGCVLVTTDCCGVREYATQENSFICEVDNEEQLYVSICSAFESDNICFSKLSACKSVKKKFDAIESKKIFLHTMLGQNNEFR